MVRKPSKARLIKTLSLAELRAALEERLSQDVKKIAGLKEKRDKLAAQVEDLNQEIEAIEGAPAPRRGRPRVAKKAVRRARRAKKAAAKKAVRRKAAPKKVARKKVGRKKVARKKVAKKAAGRRKGRMSLADAIAQVIEASGQPLAPREIRAAIIGKKILPSISKSFVQQVANTLSRSDRFKRRDDGTYTL